MYLSPEMISFPTLEPGFFLWWLGLTALLPFLAMSFTGKNETCDCGDDCCDQHDHRLDKEAVKNRIAELEGLSNRTADQNEELAELYVLLGNEVYDEAEEAEEITDLLGKAEDALKAALALNADDEITRRLGNVYLHRAVVYNDFDEIEPALEYYQKAIDTFEPLDKAGDGEAKYDIAGIRLNRGTIYHQIGEFEKAKADFDESFMAFRAVEKISDLDTRFYMAKVSVAQGSLFRDMGEPLDKIVDAYNRAMRLFVELIDIGQMDHERDLANVLMDRCVATFEDYMGRDFDTETDRLNKIGDVLVDVGRAVEILERLASGGDDGCRYDLFNALTAEGAILLDIEKFDESRKVLDRAIDHFKDFADESDPIVVNQYAGAYENRGLCWLNLDETDKALSDISEAVRLRESIVSDAFDLDDETKSYFIPTLATTYANRANVHAGNSDNEKALADGKKGLELIRSVKEDMDEEMNEIEELFENLIDQWK